MKIKKGRYLFEGEHEIQMLHYFWPEKQWYVGFRGKVYIRDENVIRDLIKTGKLIRNHE